jgi:ferritin-like metal-binding protein YciE
VSIRATQELFIHELSDIYSAEKQLTKALPSLARASSAPALREAFETHLEETHGQVERIDQVVEHLGIRLMRIKCGAMEALIEEGEAVVDEIEEGALRDVALIGGGRKVEHYEIASYGMLIALAEHLGYKDAMCLLQRTLDEERAADEKLTLLLAGQRGKRRPAKKSARSP